jgi:hypothetical protein
MTEKAKIERKIVMTKVVATKWISKLAQAEYRFSILFGNYRIKNLPDLLRSFRDGRVAMTGLKQIKDLGVKESFDGIEVWSSDKVGMVALQKWFEDRGFETTGVFF